MGPVILVRSSALATLFTLLGVILAPSAHGHELLPAQLTLHENPSGDYAVVWKRAATTAIRRVEVEPVFPEHCTYDGHSLDCGETGLSGRLRFTGTNEGLHRIIVLVKQIDGSERSHVLMSTDAQVELGSDADQERLMGGLLGGVFGSYLELGVEHILLGFDHLLFVIGLLLLVGRRRLLLWTITAFTLAHSLTLAASALELMTVPQSPVEATIALSILLLTVELQKQTPSLTRSYPWAVAFCFGLLHGFGFAGALADIGLPSGQMLTALLAFNLGVEVGQLLVIGVSVALALSATHLLRRWSPDGLRRHWARSSVIYAMGTLAAYWTIDRLVNLWPAA